MEMRSGFCSLNLSWLTISNGIVVIKTFCIYPDELAWLYIIICIKLFNRISIYIRTHLKCKFSLCICDVMFRGRVSSRSWTCFSLFRSTSRIQTNSPCVRAWVSRDTIGCQRLQQNLFLFFGYCQLTIADAQWLVLFSCTESALSVRYFQSTIV